MATHPIVHLELAAQDPAALSKFYNQIFGWKIDVDPNFSYYMFSAEGGPGGGFVVPDGKQYHAGDVIPYLGTDDVEATLKQVEEAGGKVLLPKTEIPGMGWFAFFADPAGNRMGLYATMQPG